MGCGVRLTSGCLLERARTLQRPVEYRIGDGRRFTKLHSRFVDADDWLEALLVKRRAVGSEVARHREPQAAAVGQPDEPLLRGTAEGVLTDELGALVARQSRREKFCAARGARAHEDLGGECDRAVACTGGNRL